MRIAAARFVVLRAIEDRSTTETFTHNHPTTWRQAMFQLLDEAVRGVTDPRFIEALKLGNARRPDEFASTLSIYHWQMTLEAAKHDWRQLAPRHGSADEMGGDNTRPLEMKLYDRFLRRQMDTLTPGQQRRAEEPARRRS